MSDKEEKIHHRLSPLGDLPFSPSSEASGEALLVVVVYGRYAFNMPFVGMTVSQARRIMEEEIDLDPETEAVVDGEIADPSQVIQEDQILLFVKNSGEIGGGGSRQ